jgi:lipopolysaccharide transport system ATP-binding protein
VGRAAIRVEGLSKVYQLGAADRGLKEAVSAALRGMVGGLKQQLPGGRRAPERSREDRELWALREVSFEVEQGQVVGIVGHNGAGKSVLLKILSRITVPSGGFAEVYGRVASLLEVGTGFHPELSGRENIFLNGAILGMSDREIRMKFEEIVDFSGVERFLDTPVKHYSSGMALRLGFSVAAHLEADLIFLDEVWAAGDASFQRRIMKKMQELIGGGRTALIVSHGLEQLNSLCSRVILLDHGRVVMDGEASEVIGRYSSMDARIDAPARSAAAKASVAS